MMKGAASSFSIQRFDIAGPLLLRSPSAATRTSSVTEVFNQRALEDIGIPFDVAQDVEIMSPRAGTVRGLHMQGMPALQSRITRVVAGACFEVVLDMRPRSPTFGRHVTTRLEERDQAHFYIPAGFAYGFCTLSDGVRLSCKVDAPFTPEAEIGLHWRDPVLCIDWPVEAPNAIVSKRDRGLPTLAEARDQFDQALSVRDAAFSFA